MRSPADLRSDLRRLGLCDGDTVMVHASLRAIGPVRGGADGVLEALRSTVGSDGTLLMILGAEIAHDHVNRLPEGQRAPLLLNATPFDPAVAPVFHEVGYLAEAFRRLEGTVVTDNPSGRFGANGRRAEDLVTGAPWHDYYGPDSPLDRLCSLKGRILRLGANPDTTTILHLAEYRADVPNKRAVRRHYRCLGDNGPETRMVTCLDDSNGIVEWPGEDYFALILRDYLALCRARCGRVGNAESELIDAADLVDFGARWMTERFNPDEKPSYRSDGGGARESANCRPSHE